MQINSANRWGGSLAWVELGRKSKPGIEGWHLIAARNEVGRPKSRLAVVMSRGLMKDSQGGRHVEEGGYEQQHEVAVLALPIVGREEGGFIGGWRSGAQS